MELDDPLELEASNTENQPNIRISIAKSALRR